MGMPNPNHFEGKARVKIRLLGGLVNLNKKFSFECGEKCEMFYGNALDNYILFEKCNIAMKDAEEASQKPIDWQFQSRPAITTQATLESDIHVVDPTEMHRMIETSNIGADDEAFEEWASRRFRFDMVGSPRVYEYYNYDSYKNGYSPVDSCIVDYTVNNETVVLQHMKRLNRDRFYRISVTGAAKEFYEGDWKDPWTYDTITGKSSATPWTQTQDFFLQTTKTEATFADDGDLQPYVKVAFPAMWTTDSISGIDTNDSKSYIYAYSGDVKHPWISLDRHLKGKMYNRGELKWYLNRDGRNVEVKDNVWYENDSVSIMTPGNGGFTDIAMNEVNVIRLRYEWSEQVESPSTWVECESYEVYGTSRDAVYQKEHWKFLQKYYGAKSVFGNGNSSSSSSSSSSSNINYDRLGAVASISSSSSSSSTSTIGTQMSRSSGLSRSDIGIVGQKTATNVTTSASSSSDSSVRSDLDLSGLNQSRAENEGLGELADPRWVESHANNDYGESAGDYRFTLEQADYMNDDDEANGGVRNLKFKVTIYQNTHAMVDVEHTKDLLGLAVIPKSEYDNMKFDEYVADKSHIYDAPLLAVRLDKIYSNNIPAVSDENRVYLNAMKLEGGKLPTYSDGGNTNRYITKDPFFYLTYMAKAYFIGGHRFDASSSYSLSWEAVNLQSLNLISPYSKWTDGRLDGDLQQGYKSLMKRAMFSYDWAVNNLGNPYPLYSDGSEYWVNRLGDPAEMGYVTAHKMREEDYAKTLADYYYMCSVLTEDVLANSTSIYGMNKTGMKNWMSVYAPKKLRIHGRYNTGAFIEVPYYQYGVIGIIAAEPYVGNIMVKGRPYLFETKVHNFPDLDRANYHLRMGRPNSGAPKVATKLLLTAVDTKSWPTQPGYNYHKDFSLLETIDFDPIKISVMNDYKMQFSTYRVNAWNINEGRYTVFKPAWQSIKEINNKFNTTYTANFEDLRAKYQLNLQYFGPAPALKIANEQSESPETYSSSTWDFMAP